MEIIQDVQLDFKDVLIKPTATEISSRSEVNLERKFNFKYSPYSWSGIPIIAANMDTVGTMSMAYKLASYKCLTALHKYYPVEQLINFFSKKTTLEDRKLLSENKHPLQHTFYSMGITEKDNKKFEEVVSKVGYWDENTLDEDNGGIKMVCIDVANGYMRSFVKFCKEFREKHPKVIIMAGNVVSADLTWELLQNGVDIVKVGIGPGSACTTRKLAGVGRSQLSAIIETAEQAHFSNGYIVGDGGCTVPADLSKAFGAGADFVMLGGMLAGHTESEIAQIEKDGKKYFKFYGMSSDTAMNKYSGGVNDYRSSEGKTVEIESRGSVEHTIQHILGGVRSTCAYINAKTIEEMYDKTVFYRVSMQTNDVFGNKL